MPTASLSNKIINFIRNFQHSLFMWFLLSYGTMYLIGIFTTKNIYSKFENDFTDSIAIQTLENRAKELNYLKDYLHIENLSQAVDFISHFNQSGDNVYSVIAFNETQSLVINDNIKWNNINWDMIKSCANKLQNCKNTLMHAYNLGLDHKYENYYVYASFLEINHIKYLNINFTSPHKITASHLGNIRSTEHLSQFIIFLSFICYIFISYGAVRPITQFVKRMQNQKLDSENFRFGKENELNHVRSIRNTIYEALLRKEYEEKERLTMQNTLLSQQKEAEIGKIVSQISHDLKSPLIIFEDILRENSYENFKQNFEAAKRSLNKILSLVYSLKQADKESLISRTLCGLSLEAIIAECKIYAKTKDLEFEAKINLHTRGDSNGQSFLLDHQKVERSINNLLRNAVEYAKSKVILNIELLDDTLQIQIYDDGEGVNPDILPRLFQWRNTGNVESGTGIGLYYAKQIALAHGGDLVYSHENGLTLFNMIIPNVLESNQIQTYAPSSSQSLNMLQEHVNQNEQKVVVFFIKNKEKHDSFYALMSQKQLACAFFHEYSPEFENTPCLVLYTDTSDKVLERAMEKGTRIILSKETDTPEDIYERLIRFYPELAVG